MKKANDYFEMALGTAAIIIVFELIVLLTCLIYHVITTGDYK